jgi:glycosyltransferase involved in cell wall biosynthesis
LLAVLTTHPIQYQVPLWKALSFRGKIPFRVFYMSDLGLRCGFDPGFGRKLAWDIELLSGYDHEFIDVQAGPSQDSFLWLRLRRDFRDVLRELGVRVLWIQGWQVAAYWQAVREANRLGVEVWLRGETNLRSNSSGLLRFTKRAAVKRLLDCVDRFLYIGEANRQFYLAQGIRRDRLVSAPYCVDNARFAAQAISLRSQREVLRRHWRIPDDAFCFLFVGKLVRKKRPGDLVQAVRNLQKSSTRRLHILFVGTGELDEQLRQSCFVAFDGGHGDWSDRSGSVEGSAPASFAGFLNQTEVSQAYVAADCLVLPSDSNETWGLVVNEAMASGLPCVASDGCGCAEDLILPIRPDLSYPVGDISLLQQALESVIANPPPKDLLELHIQSYDPLRTIETIERTYSATLAVSPFACSAP